MKTTSFVLFVLFSFCALTCKKESPVGPSQPTVPDTTSHNFTFQTFAFGGKAGSCVFNDVAIISPTDIWAVGAVYLDSADGAPDPFPYNAAHWDGNSWTLMKIPYNYQGQLFYHPIQCIYSLNASDIWFGGNGLEHWDGQQFSDVDPVNPFWSGQLMEKIWAGADGNIYIVGSGGLIAHYAHGNWTQVATGTSLQFNDIYGSGNQILAVCLQFDPPGGEIFSIQGNTATPISSSPIQGDQLYGIWFIPNQQYDLALDFGGIYEKRSLSDTGWVPLEITGAATTGVRGNSVNDIVVVSATGDLLHWNGVVWKSFRNQTGLAGNSYARVAISGNVVIAVGVNGTQAAITMGMRQ